LSAEDVEFETRPAPIKTKGKSPRDRLWPAVATCTNTACIYVASWDASTISFVGRGAGPEIAVYLVALLNRAVDHAVAEFKATTAYRRRRSDKTRRAAVHDFTVGMVERLCSRLRHLFAASISDAERAKAKGALERQFPNRETVGVRAKTIKNPSAASAGYAAGGRVQIAHGVGGHAGVRQIEGRT